LTGQYAGSILLNAGFASFQGARFQRVCRRECGSNAESDGEEKSAVEVHGAMLCQELKWVDIYHSREIPAGLIQFLIKPVRYIHVRICVQSNLASLLSRRIVGEVFFVLFSRPFFPTTNATVPEIKGPELEPRLNGDVRFGDGSDEIGRSSELLYTGSECLVTLVTSSRFRSSISYISSTENGAQGRNSTYGIYTSNTKGPKGIAAVWRVGDEIYC